MTAKASLTPNRRSSLNTTWAGKEPKSTQALKFQSGMRANMALWLVQRHQSVLPSRSTQSRGSAKITCDRLLTDQTQDVPPPEISKLPDRSSVSNSAQYFEKISGTLSTGASRRMRRWE
jgi:hypothetical protein